MNGQSHRHSTYVFAYPAKCLEVLHVACLATFDASTLHAQPSTPKVCQAQTWIETAQLRRVLECLDKSRTAAAPMSEHLMVTAASMLRNSRARTRLWSGPGSRVLLTKADDRDHDAVAWSITHKSGNQPAQSKSLSAKKEQHCQHNAM